MILQKRQSATLPPQHRDSGNALQVSADAFGRPSRLPRRLAHSWFLLKPEFNNEAPLGRKVGRSLIEQPANHGETVRPGVQRRWWFVSCNLGLQFRSVGFRDVGGIRDDQLRGLTGTASQQIATDE